MKLDVKAINYTQRHRFGVKIISRNIFYVIRVHKLLFCSVIDFLQGTTKFSPIFKIFFSISAVVNYKLWAIYLAEDKPEAVNLTETCVGDKIMLKKLELRWCL